MNTMQRMRKAGRDYRRQRELSMASPHGSTCAIGVMAKAPQAGRSKTRLCPPLLPDQAAELSAAFLRDSTENVAAAARLASIAAYAAYAPYGAEALLQEHIAEGTMLLLADGGPSMPKGVEGFGRCLLHAIWRMLAQGHAAACVLSSDSPTIPTGLLVRAAAILLVPGERALIGPAEDGGYYLLGLKAAHTALFTDIAWSTSRVADQTRERARDIGLELIELDPWYDVDDAASLGLLLTETEGYGAPATNSTVDRLDLRRLLLPAALPGEGLAKRGTGATFRRCTRSDGHPALNVAYDTYFRTTA